MIRNITVDGEEALAVDTAEELEERGDVAEAVSTMSLQRESSNNVPCRL